MKETLEHIQPPAFPKWLASAILLVTIVKLWLVSPRTVTALSSLTHDDALFVRLARNIIEGKWLGAYDSLTLSKGPFYPIWIAINFFMGTPLIFSQHLLYIAACIVFIIAIRPLVQRPLVLLLFYTVMIFNPMSYSSPMMTRVIRAGIYPALTIFTISCAIALLARYKNPSGNLAVWSAGLGLSLSAFWLTREEGMWLVPALLIITGFTAVMIFLYEENKKKIAFCVAPFIIWVFLLGAVSFINFIHYGVFTIVDFKNSSFKDAYGALTRVRHKDWNPKIPVPRETRERIYNVSPAFARLKPFLEGELGRNWTTPPCMHFGICDDIGGGWFLWAFRNAVARAGYYKTAEEADRFYKTMAREINEACENKSLNCTGRRSTLAPRWHREYTGPFIRKLGDAAWFLVRFKGFSPWPQASVGTYEQLQPFQDIVGPITPPKTHGVSIIKGWVFHASRDVTLLVHKKDGGMDETSISFKDDPGIYDYFLRKKGMDLPNAKKAKRFKIQTSCQDCELFAEDSSGNVIRRIPVKKIRSIRGPQLYLNIDSFVSIKNPAPHRTKIFLLKNYTLKGIARAYQLISPAAAVLALLIHIIYTIQLIRSRRINSIFIINTALILSTTAMLSILAMIHISLFRAIIPEYLAPLYPAVLIITLFSITFNYKSLTPGKVDDSAEQVK